MRALSTVLVLPFVLAPLACSDKGDAGGFGDAKPTTNDGMVTKPLPPPEAPPDFANALAVAPRFDAASKTVIVTLDIKPGFHAYAPGEEVGKPVELSIDDANGWALDGAAKIPAGVTKDLGALGKSVILEGKAELSAVVKGGTGDLSGKVMVQVCTDKACDRPKPHTFTVPTA